MEQIRSATEHEIVSTFLLAEIDSSRWSATVHANLRDRGLSEDLIRKPNLRNAVENFTRDEVLSAYRGWRRNQYIFTNWPPTFDWSLVSLGQNDLADCRYINMPEWQLISDGTLEVTVGGSRGASPPATFPQEIALAIISIADSMDGGTDVPTLIGVKARESPIVVIVEGHARITAYAMSGAPKELTMLLGTTSLANLSMWPFYVH